METDSAFYVTPVIQVKESLLKHIPIALSMLLILVASPLKSQDLPTRHVLSDVPYVAQLPNHCGPAVITSALGYWGFGVEQKLVGKAIFDAKLKGTHGSDMLLYARRKGFSAYTWKGAIQDLKQKIAQGVPVIVLQDMTSTDKNGHFRLVIGYDDDAAAFLIYDPYDPKYKSAPYDEFQALWRRHGNWSLLICRPDIDIFKTELNDKNPVVHIDLARAHFRRGEFALSEQESRKALTLDPKNPSAQALFSKAAKANASRGSSGNKKPG